MKTALITGANKGIGFETAKQLLACGFFVYVGSRDLSRGQAAAKLLNQEGFDQVKAIQLDITNAESVNLAREAIGLEIEQLDVLINNAGINGGSAPYTVLAADQQEFTDAFQTNVLGTALVTKAFVDLLKQSSSARIVNVSTSVGSLTLQSDPNWPAYDYAKYAVYAISKAALNMLTVQLAYELKDTAIKVNAVCPGYTQTDFTGNQGGSVSDAARRIIKYALLEEHCPTGKFFSEETNPATGEVAW
ncbi:SDR family NAD(P)-dependent oxidoreductase [Sphingobacterium corticis]|uniref:SDR family NAD(P)-dependent oxidoreductase n=1 Tax=Sphingobacterium corticis TaxID=1812823 RepID=A0ABW5NJ97_9SPHI